MGLLIDYSEWTSSLESGESTFISREVFEKLMGIRRTCVYCDTALVRSFQTSEFHRLFSPRHAEATKSLWVHACPQCGWWQYVETSENLMSGQASDHVVKNAKLKSFESSSRAAPVDALARHIYGRPDLISTIDPQKMETLVAAVFSDFFQCEVRHVGRTADRGVDLLLAISDEIIPVQIKRRSDPAATEAVRTVREMFGVMLRDGYRKAMVVSSANKFSAQSVDEIETAMAQGALDSFELVDRHSFVDMIGASPTLLLPSWSRIFPNNDDVRSMITGSRDLAAYRDACTRMGALHNT